ncbi:GNAT family N-acetyltransferase [Paenibacillus woosongensis]|uniref:GNAT family N-acetyltransferase n=1 Tax=Paenibacillus woosongensis TaxID=307580 RepID=A0AA95L274_9BACL|nr:GNAT family N-acetyltransferase [Paenibacillus woosongensis]WHX51009.1 GNAT family N-acetyltransferase [Paenibacillus woosongensis]
MILEKSTLNQIEIEAAILNSDPYYNRVAKGKEVLPMEEIRSEIQESLEIGAERYLLRVQQEYVGILEFLMKNPGDGYTWLGLLEIKKEHQSKGYGYKALNLFYSLMRERQVKQFRIGVISENEPGHRFWRRQCMKPVKVTTADGKEVVVYEKHL